MSDYQRLPLPLPANASERVLADSVLSSLSQWFHVETEVQGTHCTGKRLRLDAVLKPLDLKDWKDESPAVGLEFKANDPVVRSVKGFTTWIAQAIDYAHTVWDGHGRIPVFVSPFLLSGFHGSPAADEFGPVMARVLWRLGVGELALVRYHGWTLFAEGNHVLWSERRGVRHGRFWSLNQRTGSR